MNTTHLTIEKIRQMAKWRGETNPDRSKQSNWDAFYDMADMVLEKEALLDKAREQMTYDARRIKVIEEKLAEAEATLAAVTKELETRFDCHAGPGTTEPACRACLTCVSRQLTEARAGGGIMSSDCAGCAALRAALETVKYKAGNHTVSAFDMRQDDPGFAGIFAVANAALNASPSGRAWLDAAKGLYQAAKRIKEIWAKDDMPGPSESRRLENSVAVYEKVVGGGK